jgi:hypothetical protein
MPSTWYFIKVIGQYDEVLKEKKQRFKSEVENLVENINQHVQEMNELCRKVTDNANHFAMGRFHDKSEQFLRFLKSVRVHYREFYADPAMLDQFKAFTIAWMRNFSGSFLNPGSSSLVNGAAQEVQRCLSPQEVCDVVMRRISESQVAFKYQVPAEMPIIGDDPERGEATAFAPEDDDEKKCGVSWISFERSRFGRVRSPTFDGTPSKWSFGCFSVVILSHIHARLILAFFLDIALIGFNIYNSYWYFVALLFFNFVSLVSTLGCFEQIDELAKLESQIRLFESRNEEVIEKREEAKRDWEKVERLHDLWLHRTLPVLGVMGKIHAHLEDEDMTRREKLADGEDISDLRPTFLRLANMSMDCLDDSLGSLDTWMSDSTSINWKKHVGKHLHNVVNSKDIHDALTNIKSVSQEIANQSRLEDGPAPSDAP